jgi:quercetin dioxygenase-like cupin family protein
MSISIQPEYFSTETEAKAEIAAGSLFESRRVSAGERNPPHWHEFDVHVYVLEGTIRVTEVASGREFICGPGAKAFVPARTVHSEHHDPYVALLGLSVDPSTIKPPIQRSPDELV